MTHGKKDRAARGQGKGVADKPVLIVAGPTASGKSGLAVTLAKTLGGVVINADSMQVYCELEVITARPKADALAEVPHRLYGVRSVREPCSAGLWRELVVAEISKAHQKGMLPIVCGGTGLYLKTLVDGIAPLPPVPAPVREAVRARYSELGPEAFHAALSARDPAAGARLRPSDRQRLVRAWEVLEATGRSLTAWQAEGGRGAPEDFRFAAILLDPPRAELYEAVERRLDKMVAEGALEEVRNLLAMSLPPHLPALKAVGIPELARYLAGELALAEALACAKQATRRFAKRQVTWFRHQALAPDVFIMNEASGAQFSESFEARIFNFIRQILLTEAS